MTTKLSPAMPLPWTLERPREDMSADIRDASGAYIVRDLHLNAASTIVAAHNVAACNAYPRLVADRARLVERLEAHQRLWWARKQDATHMNSDEFRAARLAEYERTSALLRELGEL